ncbi:hypothetical protein LINPERHAP2_LOCUS14560 [Linum perenne]
MKCELEDKLLTSANFLSVGLQNKGWKSVPQFGEWEAKGGLSPGTSRYTTIFSEARANRKMRKGDPRRHSSFGDESDFTPIPQHPQDDSVKRRTILTYINCCIKP